MKYLKQIFLVGILLLILMIEQAGVLPIFFLSLIFLVTESLSTFRKLLFLGLAGLLVAQVYQFSWGISLIILWGFSWFFPKRILLPSALVCGGIYFLSGLVFNWWFFIYHILVFSGLLLFRFSLGSRGQKLKISQYLEVEKFR